MKKVILSLLALACFTVGTVALAANLSGIGAVSENVTKNLGGVARLITAISYVAGMAFAVGAIVKFKAHKDNPTQVPVSTGVVFLFVGVGLMFAPSLFQVAGNTVFGSGGKVSTVSGIVSFGASKPSGN